MAQRSSHNQDDPSAEHYSIAIGISRLVHPIQTLLQLLLDQKQRIGVASGHISILRRRAVTAYNIRLRSVLLQL